MNIRTRRSTAALLVIALMVPGCASVPRPAPVVAAALPPLLDVIQKAQETVVAAGKAGQLKPAEELKVQEAFSLIGASVPKLTAALRILDAGQTAAEKIKAGEEVDAIVAVINGLLVSALVPITSEPVRLQVAGIVTEASRLIMVIVRLVATVRAE